jgi:phosphoenolpyruvate carboxylase
LRDRLVEYSKLIGEESALAARISPTELYRRFISFVVVRLRHNREESKGMPYASADELEGDLKLIRDALCAGHGEPLARLFLDPLLRKVATFGLHLATLDIRQHARVHAKALEEVPEKWKSNSPLDVPAGLTPASIELLDTFRKVAQFKKNFLRQRFAIMSSAASSRTKMCWQSCGWPKSAV